MNQRLSKKDTVLICFMEKTIENINTLLAGQYTIFKLLIEKKLITEEVLITLLKDNKSIPLRKKGIKTLRDMLAPDWDDKIDFKETERDLLQHTLEKITTLSIPQHWLSEGVNPPNSTAKRNALKICHEIYSSKKMIPDQIAPTKENGVYLKYIINQKQLIIESYNDGEIAAIVVDGEKNKTLHNEDILNHNFDTCFNLLAIDK